MPAKLPELPRLENGANWALHIGAALATAAGLYATYAFGRSAERAARDKKSVFVLAVSLGFKDAKDRDRWIEKWLPMVEQVKTNEPGTISYELCQGDQDPLKLLVYERYVDKAAYETVHKTSPAMTAFKEATAGIKINVSGTSYIETNLGFM